MRVNNKKFLLIILLVGVLLTGVIILKPKEKSELYEVKLQEDNKKDLAIMVEQLDNSYKENNKIPFKGYILNQEMTKCIDNNGNEVEKDITYESGTITISTNRTIYCYLYFDRQDEIEDLSGNGNNGKNYAVTWTEEGITTSNKEEKGYVDCDLASYDFKDSITMVMRVKFNDIIGGEHIFGNWEGAGGGFIIENNSILYDLYIRGSGYVYLEMENYITTDKYYTMVGLYDGTEIKFYIDGTLVANYQISGITLPSSVSMIIGGNMNLTSTSSGITAYSYTTFTDALIFDTALTDEEIQQYFSGAIDKEQVLSEYVNKYAENKTDQKLLLYYNFN